MRRTETQTGPERIPSVAGEQGGVFTAAQALSEGWTARQIRRRLVAERWRYVAGNGLAAPRTGGQWTSYQLAVAAQLTFPSAITTHLTAAELHGFPIARDERSHATTRAIHRAPLNMVVHRVPLSAPEVLCLDGLVMVTTPTRTAIDCFSILGMEERLRLWSWVSSRRIVDAKSLGMHIAERSGRPGIGHLRELLNVVHDGAASPAELLCHKILQRSGITGWRAGVAVQDASGIIAVVDILFAQHRLVIEIDGYAAHSSRDAFINDRRRQNRLVAAGYTVLRFSWDDLTQNPQDVVRRIRHALAAA